MSSRIVIGFNDNRCTVLENVLRVSDYGEKSTGVYNSMELHTVLSDFDCDGRASCRASGYGGAPLSLSVIVHNM